MDRLIEHVSDTALMVAAFRALETEDEYGFTRDPLARRLAGERGMAIAKSLPSLPWARFGVGIRARLIDDLLVSLLADVDLRSVANLGAGLDTRPWRLELPKKLRWIEVDFAPILSYKAEVLRDERPRCQVEQINADISSAAERRGIIDSIGDGPALLLTEGLLMYLAEETVHGLARETAQSGTLRHWILDVSSDSLRLLAHGKANEQIQDVRSTSSLDAPQILAALQEGGWKVARSERYAGMTQNDPLVQSRVARMFAAAGQSLARPPAPASDDPSGVWQLAS